jgi:hypothetical protein
MEPATKTSSTTAALRAWQTTTAPYKPARSFDSTSPTMGQQMTSTSTKAKPTTATTTKSASIMSITKTITTVAMSTMSTILNTKFSQANNDYITINRY